MHIDDSAAVLAINSAFYAAYSAAVSGLALPDVPRWPVPRQRASVVTRGGSVSAFPRLKRTAIETLTLHTGFQEGRAFPACGVLARVSPERGVGGETPGSDV